MPAYLLHGFRWVRAGFSGIRVFVAIHNLDDAAAEYIQQPETTQVLLSTFHRILPDIMTRLPDLQFIEQHDPEDVYSDTSVSQPYAYVADKVITIADNMNSGKMASFLNVDVDELVKSHEQDMRVAAISELRDKLCPGQKVGWWVVYNGDPGRDYPDSEKEASSDEEEEYGNGNSDEGEGEGEGEGEDENEIISHYAQGADTKSRPKNGSKSLDLSRKSTPKSVATIPGKSTVSLNS